MDLKDLRNKIEVLYGERVNEIHELRDYFLLTFNISKNAILLFKDNFEIKVYKHSYWYTMYNIGICDIDNSRSVLINGDREVLKVEYDDILFINQVTFGLSLYGTEKYALFGRDGVQLTGYEYTRISPIRSDDSITYNERCIAVKHENGELHYYLMNKEGLIISRGFDFIHGFCNGVARVDYTNGNVGFITINGEELLKDVEGIVRVYDFTSRGVFKKNDDKLYSVSKTGDILDENSCDIKRYLTESDRNMLGLR